MAKYPDARVPFCAAATNDARECSLRRPRLHRPARTDRGGRCFRFARTGIVIPDDGRKSSFGIGFTDEEDKPSEEPQREEDQEGNKAKKTDACAFHVRRNNE